MLAGPRHVVNKDATGQLLPPIWWTACQTGACKTFRIRHIIKLRSQNRYINFWDPKIPKSRTLRSQKNTQPFDAQPRTLLFCRRHSSITPRCNRAPGHTPHAVVWLEKRAYCSIAQKNRQNYRSAGSGPGRLEQPSVFSLSPNPHHHHPLKPPSRTATLWH